MRTQAAAAAVNSSKNKHRSSGVAVFLGAKHLELVCDCGDDAWCGRADVCCRSHVCFLLNGRAFSHAIRAIFSAFAIAFWVRMPVGAQCRRDFHQAATVTVIIAQSFSHRATIANANLCVYSSKWTFSHVRMHYIILWVWQVCVVCLLGSSHKEPDCVCTDRSELQFIRMWISTRAEWKVGSSTKRS